MTNKEAKTLFYKLRSTANRLQIDLSYQLTEDEYALLAKKLEVKVKYVKLLQRFWSDMKSLGEAYNVEDDDVIASSDSKFYKDPENICRELDLRMKIYKTWRSLPEPDITIIKEVVFNKTPLHKVGEMLGVSGERVRQIKNDILKKLEEEVKKLL
jgi:DNA-directed RNA polymerase sigma subunit (sigma70/sigma32)